MTDYLFQDDAYARTCEAIVVRIDEDAVILDRTVFYPLGGGQPGDQGRLDIGGRAVEVTDTRYGDGGEIRHLVAGLTDSITPGDRGTASIDWPRRYRHMRMHTALHLLGAVLPYGVTGGNISTAKSRLDFDMEEPVDKSAVEDSVNALVTRDCAVTCRWISDAELDAAPELVRTMSVQPPRGRGRVRLLDIAGVDLQPCGGTHVRSTGEIGKIRIGKVEKKGKRNRRVNIHLDE